jgi:ribosome recycling factor
MTSSSGEFVDNELINEFLSDASERMMKSVEATRSEFATVRTGRASP